MISKIKFGIILGSAMVATAMLYAGVAHSRHQTASAQVNPPVAQPQPPAIPKPPAGTPLNADDDAANQFDAANDPNAQQADSTDDQDRSQDQNQAAISDSDDSDQAPAPAVTAHRQTISYTTSAVRVHPVAKVRVVRVVQPAVADATPAVDRPAPPVASVGSRATVVPIGTELTLRLAEPLGSKISQVDQRFSAVLDRDIDLHGRTVIPAGTPVTGKVVSAHAAGRIAGEANLQLEITAIKIGHRDLDVATSVHTFGPTIQGKNKVGRFMKGLAKRMDGQEQDVLLAEQTAYTFNLSSPLEIR